MDPIEVSRRSCLTAGGALLAGAAVATPAAGQNAVVLGGDFVDAPSERVLHRTAIYPVGLDRTWWGWTSSAGLRAALGCEARVELRIGGPYEIYFDASAQPGARGSEGQRILSFLPKRMLSFEWNAPPSFGELRQRRTWVVVEFEAVERGRTEVSISHLGWGTGPAWERLFSFFDRNWGNVLESGVKSLG